MEASEAKQVDGSGELAVCDSGSENMDEKSELMTREQPRWKGMGVSPRVRQSVVSPSSGIISRRHAPA